MSYQYKEVNTPLGTLKLVASPRGLAAILWQDDDPQRVRLGPQEPAEHHAVLDDVEKQLNEYFLGTRRSFDVPLDFHGTAFQKQVWQALVAIPYGETRTYGDIAQQVQRPTAFRAVGAANGKNPISIIAACHRVIGSTGKLTGFAGGLEAKSFLLRLEQNHRRPRAPRGPMLIPGSEPNHMLISGAGSASAL